MNNLSPEHERIATAVVDSAFKVHRELGPGLLEKIYETCMCYALRTAGFQVRRHVCVPIKYKGILLEDGLRIDMLTEEKVIVEVKAVDQIKPVWHSRILSHLKITGHQLGFLINFNVPLIKNGIKRIVLSR